MPTAEARIPTPSAGRYLTQLCDHLGHLQHGVAVHQDSGDHGGAPGGSPSDADNADLPWYSSHSDLRHATAADGRSVAHGDPRLVARRPSSAIRSWIRTTRRSCHGQMIGLMHPAPTAPCWRSAPSGRSQAAARSLPACVLRAASRPAR